MENGKPVIGDILIVDDTPANLQLLSSILEEKGHTVRMAPSGSLALLNVRTTLPDLILLDIKMPGTSGFEVCGELKNDPATSDVPIIFISASDQTADKVKAFGAGGVDYVTKPFQVEEVLARVGTHLMIHSLQKRLKAANAELEKLAATDALTGLCNRRQFFDLARREITRASRYEFHFSLMVLDLDGFKGVNDTLGHAHGDTVLKIVADCLRANSRDVDIVGRYGGDEFIVAIPEPNDSHARVLAKRLRERIEEKVNAEIYTDQRVTASIGIAEYSGQRDVTVEKLFKHADEALYEAKSAGRNCIRMYSGAVEPEGPKQSP